MGLFNNTSLVIIACIAAFGFYNWYAEEIPHIHDTSFHTNNETSWHDVVEYARANLPQQGKLMVKSDGFVYLKVDDAYIYTLFPMLKLSHEGFKIPPYFRSPGALGAHISVFNANEHIVPDEIGHSFHFTVKKIAIVKPSKYSSYVVLQIVSPELEQLRQHYGLSPKLYGHKFHISLGKKYYQN